MIQQIYQQLIHTSIIEYIAVLMGIVSVVLAKQNHVGLYPSGIISTGLYIYIMASAGLYAESALNGYYLFMSGYGWWLWHKNKGSHNARAISKNNQTDWLITIAIVLLGWLMLYFLLRRFTTSDVAAWDALVSATAWAGMWLLAKHKIENWLLLNVSNSIAIPLLVHKGIPLTALLTIVLFIIAIFGYFRWKKLYETSRTP